MYCISLQPIQPYFYFVLYQHHHSSSSTSTMQKISQVMYALNMVCPSIWPIAVVEDTLDLLTLYSNALLHESYLQY